MSVNQASTMRTYTVFDRLMHTACSICGRKVMTQVVGFYWLKNLPCNHAERWLESAPPSVTGTEE